MVSGGDNVDVRLDQAPIHVLKEFLGVGVPSFVICKSRFINTKLEKFPEPQPVTMAARTSLYSFVSQLPLVIVGDEVGLRGTSELGGTDPLILKDVHAARGLAHTL